VFGYLDETLSVVFDILHQNKTSHTNKQRKQARTQAKEKNQADTSLIFYAMLGNTV